MTKIPLLCPVAIKRKSKLLTWFKALNDLAPTLSLTSLPVFSAHLLCSSYIGLASLLVLKEAKQILD
jgi:hypothetical protein